MSPIPPDEERHFWARVALYAILDTVATLSICQIVQMYAVFPNVIYYWQRVFFTLNILSTLGIPILYHVLVYRNHRKKFSVRETEHGRKVVMCSLGAVMFFWSWGLFYYHFQSPCPPTETECQNYETFVIVTLLETMLVLPAIMGLMSLCQQPFVRTYERKPRSHVNLRPIITRVPRNSHFPSFDISSASRTLYSLSSMDSSRTPSSTTSSNFKKPASSSSPTESSLPSSPPALPAHVHNPNPAIKSPFLDPSSSPTQHVSPLARNPSTLTISSTPSGISETSPFGSDANPRSSPSSSPFTTTSPQIQLLLKSFPEPARSRRQSQTSTYSVPSPPLPPLPLKPTRHSRPQLPDLQRFSLDVEGAVADAADQCSPVPLAVANTLPSLSESPSFDSMRSETASVASLRRPRQLVQHSSSSSLGRQHARNGSARGTYSTLPPVGRGMERNGSQRVELQ